MHWYCVDPAAGYINIFTCVVHLYVPIHYAANILLYYKQQFLTKRISCAVLLQYKSATQRMIN